MKEIIDAHLKEESSSNLSSKRIRGRRKASKESGDKLIQIAIERNINELLVFLASYDVSSVIDSTDKDGLTALLHASINGYKDVAHYLLINSADTEVQTDSTSTALIEASRRGHLEIVELLLEYDADVNETNMEGMTALICACMSFQEDIVMLLLSKKASTNIVTPCTGYSALLAATEHGSVNIVAALLHHGADVNHMSQNGENALILASKHKHDLVVELLLKFQADPNCCDKDGLTALMHAARCGDLASVGLLLEATGGEQRFVAYAFAKVNEHTLVEQFLIGIGPLTDYECSTSLLVACVQGHTQVVESILQSGMNVNCTDIAGYTPLIIACQKANTEMVQLLLKYKANPNCATNDRQTVLMHTITASSFARDRSYEYLHITELLLSHGAVVTAQDNYGNTALSLATSIGHTELMHLLLIAGTKFFLNRDTNLFRNHRNNATLQKEDAFECVK